MSLSKTTLSAIQQAGTSLHRATVVVAAAVREQAEHMVTTVASQPFQAEGEQAFANFKMLARLSQNLQSLEEQLRNLYATATELASPEMDVVAALPRPSARARAAAANEAAEDAIVKPAPQRPAKPRGKKPAKAVMLTANDSKVLDYLKTVLKVGEWTALTGASVAQGAGMPLGSVGISLKKVIDSGAVKKKGRGSYQLAH
jgi:3-methyladenine DNA glycosylase/8-oxoguanine DNA glycosylase